MFEQTLEKVCRKARELFNKRSDVQEFARDAMNSFTSAELVFQQADRLTTLIMYDKRYEEVEDQVAEIVMQLVITLELEGDKSVREI